MKGAISGNRVSIVPQPMKRRNRGALKPSGAVWREIREGDALPELLGSIKRDTPGAAYSNPCPSTYFQSWTVDRVPVRGFSA